MGATNRHAFDRHDRVAVFKWATNGRPSLEGYAAIFKRLDTADYYLVRFEEAGSQDAGACKRFIWPGEQQENPDRWLARKQAEFDEVSQ